MSSMSLEAHEPSRRADELRLEAVRLPCFPSFLTFTPAAWPRLGIETMRYNLCFTPPYRSRKVIQIRQRR